MDQKHYSAVFNRATRQFVGVHEGQGHYLPVLDEHGTILSAPLYIEVLLPDHVRPRDGLFVSQIYVIALHDDDTVTVTERDAAELAPLVMAQEIAEIVAASDVAAMQQGFLGLAGAEAFVRGSAKELRPRLYEAAVRVVSGHYDAIEAIRGKYAKGV